MTRRNDDDVVREAPRWWLRQQDIWYSTAPKLKSAEYTDENKHLWEGHVAEEGTTRYGERWYYVVFEGFGLAAYSKKRRERVLSAFIVVEAASGASMLQGKARAQAQFLIFKAAQLASVRETYEIQRYGPYIADNIKATNKWELVQIAIGKAFREWLLAPLSEDVLEVPTVSTVINNLDWVSEIAFPDMDRGFKGL